MISYTAERSTAVRIEATCSVGENVGVRRRVGVGAGVDVGLCPPGRVRQSFPLIGDSASSWRAALPLSTMTDYIIGCDMTGSCGSE